MSWIAKLLGRGKHAATYAFESVPTVEHHGYHIPQPLAAATGILKNFTEISNSHMDVLRRFGDLQNARDIVEVGCGVGRDAIPLTATLPDGGSYLGIDVMGQSIKWAKDNITARDKRFEFVHFDVADQQHNPTGTSKMSAYSIPRAEASVDLVFMFSVFTHMFPADMRQYLQDYARILRPGGRVLASMFIVDHAIQAHLLKTGSRAVRHLTFQHEVEPGFFHNDPAVVPGATGYSLERITAEVEEAGLSVGRFAKGSWAGDGESEINGQDILVFEKH